MSIEISGILEIAWVILQWTIDYVWIICGTIFIMIMAKTLLELSSKIVDESAPGVKKIMGRR